MKDAGSTLYVFQNGKHKGQTIEQVFKEDPAFIWRLYNSMESKEVKNKNRLQIALEELVSSVFSLAIAKDCPYCRERKVSFLLLPSSGDMQLGLSCCDDADCLKMLRSTRPGELLRIAPTALTAIKQREVKRFFILLKKACQVSSLI